MAWVAGLCFSVVGILVGSLISLVAAQHWPSFDNRLLILAGLIAPGRARRRPAPAPG